MTKHDRGGGDPIVATFRFPRDMWRTARAVGRESADFMALLGITIEVDRNAILGLDAIEASITLGGRWRCEHARSQRALSRVFGARYVPRGFDPAGRGSAVARDVAAAFPDARLTWAPREPDPYDPRVDD